MLLKRHARVTALPSSDGDSCNHAIIVVAWLTLVGLAACHVKKTNAYAVDYPNECVNAVCSERHDWRKLDFLLQGLKRSKLRCRFWKLQIVRFGSGTMMLGSAGGEAEN